MHVLVKNCYSGVKCLPEKNPLETLGIIFIACKNYFEEPPKFNVSRGIKKKAGE